MIFCAVHWRRREGGIRGGERQEGGRVEEDEAILFGHVLAATCVLYTHLWYLCCALEEEGGKEEDDEDIVFVQSCCCMSTVHML